MQDLRLIGVHEDGLHLILADDDGTRYRLPLDEPLRAAVRRDRPRLGQLQIELDGGLRPRDVQAMIRGGLTTEEAAERAGWTVEKVRRYEGPILAEREHVASLGRQVRLRSPGAGPSSTMLGTRVDERLRSRQIDAGTARWDSRRDAKGRWTVVVFFNAGGRQRQAEWSFDLVARAVQANDDEARWLSADEQTEPEGPIPAPHLRDLRATEVYDVEAEGGVTARGHHRAGDSIDLMAAMRQRSAKRGRRRRPGSPDVPGRDAAPADALPLAPLAVPVEAPGGPPPAHPHARDDSGAGSVGSGPPEPDRSVGPDPSQAAEPPAPEAAEPPAPEAAEPPAPEAAEPPAPEAAEPPATPPTRADDAGSTEGAPAPADERDAAGGDPGPADETAAEQRVAAPKPPPRRAAQPPNRPATRRSGRPSVPSWDDIMFGRKPD